MSLLGGESGLHLVREALEGVIEPTTASAVLFDALEVDGSDHLPGNAEELLSFVRGPLGTVVERRIGAVGAGELVERIAQTIQRIVQGLPVRAGAATTLEIHVGTGPVRVLVLSASSSIAVRLRAALGGLQVHVTGAPDVEAARDKAAGFDPQVIVVDALSPAADAGEVMRFLDGLPVTTTAILWGEEQAFGRELSHMAIKKRVRLTTVERAEGVEPVLDLIRSRHH